MTNINFATATAAELAAAGYSVKTLKAGKARKQHLYADRIKGGSTRVRTGAGSRSVSQTTKNSAMTDVR